MKKSLFLAVTLFASVFTQPVLADKFEVEPIHDAHSFLVAGKAGFGFNELLELKFNAYAEWRTDAVMKFDISSANVSAPYTKATLKLFISDNGVATTVRVLKIERSNAKYDWTESTISGSYWPGVKWQDDKLADIILEGELDQMYYEADITDWVNAEKNSGSNIINLNIRVISGNASENTVFINSRENLEGNHPILVLEGLATGISATESQNATVSVRDGQLLLNGFEGEQQYQIISLSGIIIRQGQTNGVTNVSDITGYNIVKVGGISKILKF